MSPVKERWEVNSPWLAGNPWESLAKGRRSFAASAPFAPCTSASVEGDTQTQLSKIH